MAVKFVNDWVRVLGGPRRLISDIGGPGFTGAAWGSSWNIFGWQDVRAPAGSAYQNGLCGRAARIVKAVMAIMAAEGRSRPNQLILNWATIAKNHVPHATSGIPPAYGMTGRCDILSGYSATAWQPDPPSDSLMLDQASPMVKIMQSRNAIMTSDANNRIGRCIRRNIRDRANEPFSVGCAAQLAIGKARVGPWGVIAATSGNIAVEEGARLAKWPKCKARMICDDARGACDSVPTPEGRSDIPPITSDVSDVDSRSEIDSPPDIDPGIDAEGIHANPAAPASRSQDNLAIAAPTLQFPDRGFCRHESLICANSPINCPGDLADGSFCMGDPTIDNGGLFHDTVDEMDTNEKESPIRMARNCTSTGTPDAYTDDDALRRLGPPRLHPRVAFLTDVTRKAIETEITDWMAAKTGYAPSIFGSILTIRDSDTCLAPSRR